MPNTAPNLWEPQTIGERLRRLRERAGLEQAELAQRMTDLRAPATQGLVSRFEKYGSQSKNARKPQWAHICALATIFDVRYADLGATEDEYPELRFVKDAATRVSLRGRHSLPPTLEVLRGNGKGGGPIQAPLVGVK